MAELTVQEIAEAGLTASYTAAAAGGDSLKNDGRTFLHVKNGGAGSTTVTVTAQRTAANVQGMGGLTKGNAGGAVAAGAEGFFGPFPSLAFNDATGKVAIGYSDVTSVTVAAIRLPLAR